MTFVSTMGTDQEVDENKPAIVAQQSIIIMNLRLTRKKKKEKNNMLREIDCKREKRGGHHVQRSN